MASPKANIKALREHLVSALKSGGAHVPFEEAVKNLPVALRGKVPNGAEHSLWQVLEHIRIAQWDILEFSRDPKHVSPTWPAGYWPKTAAPPNNRGWGRTVAAIRRDLDEMCELVSNEETDLFAKIPHGDGQTILREALLIADHNAYHLGQFVLVRKLLGAWK